MIASFLLLALICTLLVFLVQRASQRQLTHLAAELREAKAALHAFDADKQLIDLRSSLAQLRKQFEEKSEILHQTRTQLFAAEGQLLSLQKERNEQECFLSDETQVLLHHLQHCEDECHALEQDVLHLQDLVSTLLVQKPEVRKAKKDPEADLFSILK